MQPNLIDQLEVFLTVAETGSFSAAAKQLGRAVSAVSYAIANLEAQLQIALFDRSGYRPDLTEAGRAVLADAEIIFRRVDRLTARVSALKLGHNVEIRLAVDAGFSRARLADAVADLAAEYPHVNLRIKTVHESRVMEELREGRAQIGIVGLQPGLPGKTIDGRDIAVHRHYIVAAPGYPLAKLNAGFPLSALDDHRQIIVADYEVDTRTFDYRVHTTDVLIVDTTEMQIELIRRGVGWGFALDHQIEAELRAGHLLELHCAAMDHPGLMRFGAVWMVKTPPGPAALRLLDRLAETDHRTGKLQSMPGNISNASQPAK